MTDKNRPSGPLWFDMRPMLMQLSVLKLLDVANGALNKLSLRDLAEVIHDAGFSVELDFHPKSEDDQ